MKKILFLLILVIALWAFTASHLTLFVLPPVGPLTEGSTVVIRKSKNTRFIDSPDAMCNRNNGSVDMLCKGVVISGVSKTPVVMKLPYSQTLYNISINGIF